MAVITSLIPRQPVPDLTVTTTAGPIWKLSEQNPKNFTMVVVYRGLHCPICRAYLSDLQRRLADIGERGVSVIVTSTDSEERVRQAQADWKLADLTMGYGFGLDDARSWGLFVSSSNGVTSIGIEEPALFGEPGLFLVRPDGALYFSTVQTMPFARPHFADIVGALDTVITKNYPARGEVLDY
jgi:peroxiredoxin